MGAILSLYWLRPRRIFTRQESNGRQATSGTRNSPYRYPPGEGSNYFGSHFYLGNCKFNSPSPEVFLFGENNDLNYLATHPVTFPYKPDRKLRATRTLRSLINVQKDCVKIVKTDVTDNYTIEFTFDSDVDCCFRIVYCMRDDVNLCELTNIQLDDKICKKWSPLFHYKSGAGQTFSQPDHILDAAQMSMLSYDASEGGEYPLVILMETVDTISSAHQLQITVATIDEFGDNGHVMKVLKQMLCVDGITYVLQEIYGLENKGKQEEQNNSSDEEDDDFEDAIEEGSECVICFSEVRDTLILPCRHFCICTTCASSLRYQASNCPICRAPFHALLSLTALEEIEGDDPDEICNQQNTNIPGYRSVPLMQALNGYSLEQRGAAGEATEDPDSTQDPEHGQENTPEQIDVLPIEVPLSPLANGQLPHVTVECDLPGALTDGTLRTNTAETIGSRNSVSTSDNDVASASSKEIELSETSSNVSGESSMLLLSNKPESSRGSKRKKFFNGDHRRNDQMDVELRVICNGSILDQDSTQTASC